MKGFNELEQKPGVAELADALDSKSNACRLLIPAHRYSAKYKVYQRSESRFFKLALLCSLLLIVWLQISESARAQERKAYSVPFRAERGYLLLQTKVNAKPAVLILDTGSPVSFSSGHVLQFHAKDGAVSFRFDDRKPLNAQYYPPERIAYDGILGNDVLSGFASVTIDYKAQTVTLAY